ncbi:hypothetical protein LTR36_009122 [Oleoguttula mirabilis]|uniref:histidine kinase n=1 Tax=Oleoguttula mirabilis TaxID=1507867 RepID=A0AAV9J6R8_9PEZI|nr:hypothetical protein LTR36_009122 [Oleoguttula mirabilis]
MIPRPELERFGSAQEDAKSESKNLAFHNLLPGSDDIWERSSLGSPDKWPDAVQALSLTLASFSYPAALFWGEEFVLLHNEEWTKVGGASEQGQGQRGNMGADAFNALSSALRGGEPKRIPSQALLRSDPENNAEKYVVLISPLFDNESERETASGLLAQLFPKQSRRKDPERDRKQHREQDRKQDGSGEEGRELKSAADGDAVGVSSGNSQSQDKPAEISELGTITNDLPLDEHSFFFRFAEMLPSGLAILDHKAQAVFVNQHFYELTTHRGDNQSFMSWPQSIHPEDYDRVLQAYHDAFVSQQQLRTEFRAQGKENPWRLLLLTPLGEENLQHASLREYGGFICSIVDITAEKSAELAERKAAQEARERKEQQERFIDMISHEIRNPLSAVLHCSEDIEDAVADKNNVDFAAINEAVDTINLCISHQRRLVDDVLSFSKLDASMLTLTPKPCQPSQQLAISAKMFQPEFRKQRIEFEYRIDRSYPDYDISWVMADVARIGQVLINLVSNAIKFTAKSTGQKKLVVSVGATHDRPTSFPPSVVFFNPDESAYRVDATNSAAWGDGDQLYIMVAVRDTGIGISEEGQMRLFERFRQATPKTEEVYGGSGLGLNISRKICHLHGGDIGVSSKEGCGSTFAFFFKARRSGPARDYDGRPEEESVNQAAQVKELGNTSPEHMDQSLMPESLKNPPVKEKTDITPQQSGEKDDRYRQTQKVAQGMHEEDAKANPERSDTTVQQPSNDEKRRSKEAAAPDRPAKTSGQIRRNAGATASPPASGPRLLLVEDNIINQRIVHRKLQAKGFRVTIANHGREAVEAVRHASGSSAAPAGNGDGDGDNDEERRPFDIILMDQEMPVLDGNAATREIRELEKQGEVKRVPILGVSANVRGEQQDEMVESGMDEVISKPYRIEDMVRKIHTILDRKT